MATNWKNIARGAACALVVGAGTLSAAAQPATADVKETAGHVDAKADEVLARSIEMMWGELAETRDIDTVMIKGTMSLPAMGIEGTISIWLDMENEISRSVVEIPGLAVEKRGIYEDTAWSESTMTGPRIIEGPEAEQMIRDSDFFAAIDYETTYSTREHLGMEEIAGQSCDKLRLVRADDGTEQISWYSPKGLVLKQQMTTINEMGEVPITTMLEDYREVGSAMMAFRTVVDAMGNKQVLQFEEIVVNEPIEADDLKPTPGVLKMMG